MATTAPPTNFGDLGTSLFNLIYPQGQGSNYANIGVTTAPLSFPQQEAVGLGESLIGPTSSLFNLSAGDIANFLQGNFPGLGQETGNMMTGLFNSLWGAAQPALEQGSQKIESQATAAGQRGISTPAAAEQSNLYTGTIDKILADVMGAGVNQYNTNLGLQSTLAQLGLQQPQSLINTLGQTGGLQQGVAQKALSDLYAQFLQQTGMSQADITSMLDFVTGNIAVPNEPPIQYGRSGFQDLIGAFASIYPLFNPARPA